MTVAPIETCTATARSGNRCQKRPEPGQRVCRMHGGAAPGAVAKAEQRRIEARLRGMLKDMGADPVTNPALELARLAGEVVGWKDLLLTKVDELDSLVTRNMEGTEQAKAVVSLLTAAFTEANKILTSMTRIGLDATALGHVMAQPSREQAETLSRVLDHVLAGLDLSDDQRGRVPGLLADTLRTEGLM